MKHPLSKLFTEMLDRRTGVSELQRLFVNPELVSNEMASSLNTPSYLVKDDVSLSVRNGACLNPSFPLNHPNYRGLIRHFTVHSVSAADISLVNLNHAGEHIAVLRHQLSDLLTNSPRRLIGYAKLSFQFLRGNAVSRSREKVNSIEPESKRRGRLLKDSSGNRVDLMARSVGVTLPTSHPIKAHSFWVFLLKDIVETSIIIRELPLKLLNGVFHGRIIYPPLLAVKG